MTRQDRWLLPDGIEELLPRQAAQAEQLRRQVLDLFATWGYQLVMPPLVEFTDSLLVGVGEDLAHHSFRLTDQISGKPMAIRPDITSQVARIDAHSMKSDSVNRLCYAGSVLHALPKSFAASRCPILAGAEIYGNASIDADIEAVLLMLEMLQQIGGKRALTLDIGHSEIYRSVEAEIQRCIPEITPGQLKLIYDAVQRKSVPDLQTLVASLINDRQLAEVILALPMLCGSVRVLPEARQLLSPLGESVDSAIQQIETLVQVVGQRFPSVNVYLDLAELCGYEYHTGLVFAAFAEGFGAALANGGRYDDLGAVFGRARPATGFNTDIKNLIKLSGDYKDSEEIGRTIAAPVSFEDATTDDESQVQFWAVVAGLRTSGERVVFVEYEEASTYERYLARENGQWIIRQ